MTINASLTPFRLVVGGVDVTRYVVTGAGSRSALDYRVSFVWSFTFELADPLAAVGDPSDLDPVRGIWDPGTVAQIYLTDSKGAEHLQRTLRVWKNSYNPVEFAATVELRCRVAISKSNTDPKLVSKATPLNPKTRQQLIIDTMGKEGIPSGDINFLASTMDDEFPVPLIKGEEPYLDTAQQLATPVQQWFWAQKDEDIQFYQWPENKRFDPLFVLPLTQVVEFDAAPDTEHLPKSIIANGTRTDVNVQEMRTRNLDTYAFLRDVYQIFPLAYPRSKVFGDEPILYKRVQLQESGNPNTFTQIETTYVCLGALAQRLGVDKGSLGLRFLQPELPPPFISEADGTTRLNPSRPEGTRLTDLTILSRRTTVENYSDQVSIPNRVELGDRRTIQRTETVEVPRCVLPNHYLPFTVPPGLALTFQLELLTQSVVVTDYIGKSVTRNSLKYGQPISLVFKARLEGGDLVDIGNTYEIKGGPPAGEEYLALDGYDKIPPEDDPPSASWAATKETAITAEVEVEISAGNPLATASEEVGISFVLTQQQMEAAATHAVDLRLGQSRAANIVLPIPDHLIANPDDLWKMIIVEDLCYFPDSPAYGFTADQARFGFRGIYLGKLATIPTPYHGIPDYFPSLAAFELWPYSPWTLYKDAAIEPTFWIPYSNGIQPYAFSGINLPTGVTVDPAGAISGIPTTAGVYSATITGVDGDGTVSSRTLSITVLALPAFNPLQSVKSTGKIRLGFRAEIVQYTYDPNFVYPPESIRLAFSAEFVELLPARLSFSATCLEELGIRLKLSAETNVGNVALGLSGSMTEIIQVEALLALGIQLAQPLNARLALNATAFSTYD